MAAEEPPRGNLLAVTGQARLGAWVVEAERQVLVPEGCGLGAWYEKQPLFYLGMGKFREAMERYPSFVRSLESSVVGRGGRAAWKWQLMTDKATCCSEQYSHIQINGFAAKDAASEDVYPVRPQDAANANLRSFFVDEEVAAFGEFGSGVAAAQAFREKWGPEKVSLVPAASAESTGHMLPVISAQEQPTVGGDVEDFVCPITQEFMEDPVVTIARANQQIFDAESLARWHQQGGELTCPLTRQRIAGVRRLDEAVAEAERRGLSGIPLKGKTERVDNLKLFLEILRFHRLRMHAMGLNRLKQVGHFKSLMDAMRADTGELTEADFLRRLATDFGAQISRGVTKRMVRVRDLLACGSLLGDSVVPQYEGIRLSDPCTFFVNGDFLGVDFVVVQGRFQRHGAMCVRAREPGEADDADGLPLPKNYFRTGRSSQWLERAVLPRPLPVTALELA